MEILIRLAGVQLGPYSEEQVRQHISDGLLSLTDLAKVEGTEEWASLAEILAQVTRESRSLSQISLAAATVALPGSRPPRTSGKAAAADAPQPDAAPIAEPAAAIEPEAIPEVIPEPPRRAPALPPGMQHLPERSAAVEEPEPAPPSAGPPERKTLLRGPTGPATPPNVAQAAATTVTTSPLLGSPKKTGRAAMPSTNAQKTSPLPTTAITKPWRPPAAAPGDVPPSTPDSPTKPLPKHAEPEPGDDALARSLQAKTVPMRNKPTQPPEGVTPAAPPGGKPNPVTTPATTAPMPTRPVFKPNRTTAEPETKTENLPREDLPPGSVGKPPRKRLDRMVLPDSGPIVPPTPLSTEARKRLEAVKAVADNTPLPEDEPPPRTLMGRIMPVLISLTAVLAIAIPYYVWSPYHSAKLLRGALQSGHTGDLQAMIDFDSVRASLKEQVKAQAGSASDAAQAKALATLDASIDRYVTPEGISALVTGPEKIAPDESDKVISPKVAARLLLPLYTPDAPKFQGLASLVDFVIDRDVALLHLGYQFLGWKLKSVELRPQSPALSAGGVSPLFLAPVVNTYLAHGDAKGKRGDWSGAVSEYTHVLTLDPKSSVAYNARGLALQAKGDLDGAIKDFTQTLANDPQNAPAYNDRGNARYAKGDADGAIGDYTQAIRIDPTLASAYDSRGNAKASKDDFDGAIADYTQSIVIDPSKAQPYSDRGFARQANGNADGAIADYTSALNIDPKAATTYYNRGLARQAQGNLDAAITDFDHALAFDPKIAYAYYFRGNAKSMTHDLDGAIKDYTQALQLNPKIAQAYSNRGNARRTKGDLDGAIEDFTAALVLDPKLAAAYFSRSEIKAEKNDLDGAIADSTHALDLDPKNGDALYTRGFAKLAKGNLDGAAADLRQFCTMNPRDHEADHARAFLWLIGKAQGAQAGSDPDQDLSHALESNWNSNPSDLISKSATFLLGRVPETDYLAAASSADAKTDQVQHCQAWYFAVMKRLLSGDRKGAIDAFNQCLATGQKDVPEYLLATAQLSALQPVAPTAAPVPTP